MIETLKQIVIEGGTINEEQAVALSQSPDKEALYKAAHQITRHFMGNKFDTCSIINAKSGNCSENCKWCAQSGHYNTVVALYPLLPAEECVHQALHNRQQGIERFGLVTSGKRLSDGEIRKLTETVRYIKQASDIKCCASLGLLNKEQLKELRESGVENYHCNIETAPSHFRTLCTTHTIEQKLETIHMAREEGFPHLFRRYHRHGGNHGTTDRDGPVTPKRTSTFHPLKPATTDTGNSACRHSPIIGRRVSHDYCSIPFYQPGGLPPFLGRTFTVE